MGNHEKSTNSGFLEELSYNHQLESQTTDLRGKQKQYSYANINNGQSTGTSGAATFKPQSEVNLTSTSERGAELMRLKKEYHNMVRTEISKMKKDDKDGSS